MHPSLRLLATTTTKPAYLTAGAPTGLTGLLTHAAPRTALLSIYSTTLTTLRTKFPEHSLYRQSTETLTLHRMRIVESIKPSGLTEWQSRVQPVIEAHPDAFRKVNASGGGFNIVWKDHATLNVGEEDPEFNEPVGNRRLEGPRSAEERKGDWDILVHDPVAEARSVARIEPEPSLTAEQVGEMEQRIGAGLIEEVIQVAEGEAKLAEVLAESQA